MESNSGISEYPDENKCMFAAQFQLEIVMDNKSKKSDLVIENVSLKHKLYIINPIVFILSFLAFTSRNDYLELFLP